MLGNVQVQKTVIVHIYIAASATEIVWARAPGAVLIGLDRPALTREIHRIRTVRTIGTCHLTSGALFPADSRQGLVRIDGQQTVRVLSCSLGAAEGCIRKVFGHCPSIQSKLVFHGTDRHGCSRLPDPVVVVVLKRLTAPAPIVERGIQIHSGKGSIVFVHIDAEGHVHVLCVQRNRKQTANCRKQCEFERRSGGFHGHWLG
ncbi:MAG: Uncharacterised protein [Flavobacteriia bacterium]|nr:MAG: Uncharacterised protein [Flavobacteriia bacterium]